MEEEAGRSEKQEEVAERKPAEEDAGPSEKQEQVADRKPVQHQEAGPSTATPEKGCFDYDVFISFRGEDTLKHFTSHLYKELAETRGITTFIDNKNLNKGEKISERIEGSKIFVPVFSQNYAGSKWCLKEIAKMVEIYKREGGRRPIIPIFYDVDPSDVRHYGNSFGIAFQELQQNEKFGEMEINEWKAALIEAGKISGYDLSKDERTTEAEIITDIGNMVSHMLRKVPFHIQAIGIDSGKVPFDIQPVGIDSCIDTLKQMLEKEKDCVRMIGIWGMGGIGKTTLAMALYNQLFLIFESSFFVSDIREHEKRKCVPSLEDKLKNEVFGGNMTAGNRFGSKKFLLILDDVDHIDQLEVFKAKLGDKEKWFGVGSRIIVTTRDKKVLLQFGLQDEDIYFLEGLNREDSLQLFRHHAFDNDQLLAEFNELSRKVVEVAQGLPLALKVFGSLFYGLKKQQQWEEKLKKLKRDQHKKVHERLKISYHGLVDREKRVFLDIACFFIGKKKEYPVYMWEACNYSPTGTLEVLQHKSLIKVNENDEFGMHDQIRDMGRRIVKEEGNSDPLRYSRLWRKSQVLEVLVDAKVSQGNPYVQGIHFNKVFNEKIEMSLRVIEAMPSLRMIVGADGRYLCFEDEEETIRRPSNIRWLEWRECPYQTLTFHNNRHEQLCVLDLSNGYFRDFRSHRMAFPNLKVLDLSGCLRLKRAPDFTHFPSLEKLVLDECCSLMKMDESIGHLKKLVKLSMMGCKKLIGLPIGLHKLASLESLVLSGCNQISVLPTQIGDLTSLKYLGLSGTSISAVPDSIGRLQSLEQLEFTGCVWLEKVPDSICDLESLSDLSLQYCELLKKLPNSMGMLTSLKGLKIDYCTSLREVPDSLADLNNDLQISLEGCNLFEKLPRQFVGRKSLRRLPDSLKPVEEKTGPSTATPLQHQLKRKKPIEESEENHEQIKRRRKPVKEKERPSTARDFDVFISFRGEDTRNGFTSHLHQRLKAQGIAFIDSEDLEKGGKISVLFERIERSKIFVPVFSQNYADSKWCLKEIAKMVEIYKREEESRRIIPIFYHVDPSDVSHYRKSFEEAFQKHQKNKELGEAEINEWKAALTEAANKIGFDISKDERTTEAEIITDIGNEISHILRKVPFHIQPVGIDCCIDTLKQMLEKEKDGVRVIGICGMGGIGKTTLAMTLYNELFRTFEDCCFLSDISENGKGLASLQKKLIRSILNESMSIDNVQQGVSLMKQRLGKKKVLLVLDDVNDHGQLEALTSDRGKKQECFGAGSKIIITTRDKKVLIQHGLQDDDIYFLEGLNKEDSLQLFCDHAFDNDQPLVGFDELSWKVVEVAQGLPLALKEFGSLFYGLKEKQEWEEKLKKIKLDQPKKLHERLKISYDALVDYEKCVFLDIACFFIGKKKEYPMYMWEACNCSPTVTLEVLQHKSLIEVNENDEFEMHDQLRDMGRKIVKEEGNFDTLKYSRPWSKNQVLEVLMDAKVSMGNPNVQVIDFQKVGDEAIEMSWKVIEKMQSLRMIIGANYDRCFVDKEEIIRFPSNLRWFSWNNCPYEMLAFYNDQHEKICVLDLSDGDFRDFGSHRMAFPNLKVLDLSWCLFLERTPDFTHFPSLQKLVLDQCWSLTKIDESIGHLKELVELSMVGREQISVLPDSIVFPKLKVLNLSRCLDLKCTPGFTHFPSLQKLVLDDCWSLTKIDESIGHLKELVELSMKGCKQISVLPDFIGSLQSLEKLDLTGCFSLEKVPNSICGLKKLSYLSLQYCELLKQLPNSMRMLPSLRELKIDYCKSLRKVPDSLGDLNNDLQISLVCCTRLEKLRKSARMSANHSEEKAGALTATREKGCYDFDMFISFRGEDVQKGFVGHLKKALVRRGITAFVDREDLIKEEEFSDLLLKHMERSKIFVPVFSKGYAESKRCLREIAKMVEIHKRERGKRPIIPVFYDVEPSDVKHCRASFSKAFQEHERHKEMDKEQINGWKAALSEAGNIRGCCLSDVKGNEARLITWIIKRVTDILRKVSF